jgi:hypothetical protein
MCPPDSNLLSYYHIWHGCYNTETLVQLWQVSMKGLFSTFFNPYEMIPAIPGYVA